MRSTSAAFLGALIASCDWPATSTGRHRPCEPYPACTIQQEVVEYFEEPRRPKFDVLFVVDDSPSMTAHREALRQNLPPFIGALRAIPGGLPDLHIGVVSTSLGAGAAQGVGACPPGGDRGVMLRGRGNCPGAEHGYLVVTGDPCGAPGNFDGSLSDAFACIADLGNGGCGIEQPLAAAARALGAPVPGVSGVPEANAGFLRDDAMLAIVFITDEDDCSVAPDSAAFAGTDFTTDTAAASFRCAQMGHRCAGEPLPETPADGLSDCVPAVDGGLVPVDDFVKAFKALTFDDRPALRVLGRR